MVQVITSGADVRIDSERAWVLVIGSVDEERAASVAELVGELSRDPLLRRVSIDLSCAVTAGPAAAATLDGLRLGAMPWVDVVTPGAVGRLARRRH